MPAIEADVVDMTGAGDAFVGAVAAGLAEGTSLLDAARMGTELASLVCQADGGTGVHRRRAAWPSGRRRLSLYAVPERGF
nr:PfkB family carbohydrate kinase [Tessaracoccus timonensis]